MAEPAAATSVVKDGIVDLSLLKIEPGAAAGKERPKAVELGADPYAADPTKDPAWAQFERAHADSYAAALPPTANEQRTAELISKLPPELAVLLGPAGMKPPAPQGSPAAAIGQVPAGPVVAQPTAAAGEQPKATSATPEATEQRVKALSALKRDGWKESMIQKLSDAELLEVGLQRHASQADVEAKLNERRQATREAQAPPTTTKPESGATPASGGPGQTAPATFEPVVKQTAEAIARHFTEQFGEEIGKPVGVAMEAGFKMLASHFDAQHQKALAGLEALAEFVEGEVANQVRRQWATEFPQTADEAVWKQIEQVYDRLADSGSYEGRAGMLEAYEHARRIVLPGAQPVSAAQRSAYQVQVDQQRANGGLTVGARAAATAVKSEEQAEFESFLRAHQLSDAALQVVAPALQQEWAGATR